MEKEFYTFDDKVYCQTEGKCTEVTERDTDLIDGLLEAVENFYPEAYNALKDYYSESMLNKPYYRFLMARRFLKCNFGDLDTTSQDIDGEYIFHFEKVSCPMRGECKFEGVICSPRYNCKLSDAEMRVMRIYYQDRNIEKIADMLYLSGHTVKNHIRAAYAKLGIHTRGEFISYASKHQLFG